MAQQHLTAHSWANPPAPGSPDTEIGQVWQAVRNTMSEAFAAHTTVLRVDTFALKQAWPGDR